MTHLRSYHVPQRQKMQKTQNTSLMLNKVKVPCCWTNVGLGFANLTYKNRQFIFTSLKIMFRRIDCRNQSSD